MTNNEKKLITKEAVKKAVKEIQKEEYTHLFDEGNGYSEKALNAIMELTKKHTWTKKHFYYTNLYIDYDYYKNVKVPDAQEAELKASETAEYDSRVVDHSDDPIYYEDNMEDVVELGGKAMYLEEQMRELEKRLRNFDLDKKEKYFCEDLIEALKRQYFCDYDEEEENLIRFCYVIGQLNGDEDACGIFNAAVYDIYNDKNYEHASVLPPVSSRIEDIRFIMKERGRR